MDWPRVNDFNYDVAFDTIRSCNKHCAISFPVDTNRIELGRTIVHASWSGGKATSDQNWIGIVVLTQRNFYARYGKNINNEMKEKL